MHNHHGHNHHSTAKNEKEIGNIKVAFFLNLFFTIIEIVGGIMSNSVAILADAIHDLGDSIALGVAWYFQNISKKGSDKSYSYGYRRFSVLGALINSLVLIIGSIFILTETIPRLIHPEESKADLMIGIAIIGIIANSLAVFKLKGSDSINVKVVRLHLLEDVLGWVAVLIGAIIMMIWDIPIIDPILSLVIFAYILYNVIKNLRSVIKIIMQGTPTNQELKDVQAYLDKHSEIKNYHDLHLWTMDGEYNIMTVHIKTDLSKSMSDINSLKKSIRHDLLEMGIEHTTIEFDDLQDDCELDDC